MIKQLSSKCYEVKGTNGLAVGDLYRQNDGEWLFWPSPRRNGIDLKTSDEISAKLKELNHG